MSISFKYSPTRDSIGFRYRSNTTEVCQVVAFSLHSHASIWYIELRTASPGFIPYTPASE